MAQSEAFYNPDMDIILQKITPFFLRGADLIINSIGGDFVNEDSHNQDIDFILLGKKGQFFWEPLIGYDVGRLQNAKIDLVQENSTLVAELRKDGFNIITDLLIGNTNDFDFIDSVSPSDRSSLPVDSLVINVNADRV